MPLRNLSMHLFACHQLFSPKCPYWPISRLQSEKNSETFKFLWSTKLKNLLNQENKTFNFQILMEKFEIG
jgi:hypothetical protein